MGSVLFLSAAALILSSAGVHDFPTVASITGATAPVPLPACLALLPLSSMQQEEMCPQQQHQEHVQQEHWDHSQSRQVCAMGCSFLGSWEVLGHQGSSYGAIIEWPFRVGVVFLSFCV